MSQPIRRQGGHLVYPICPKNTNLVEDSKILLPVKFRWIPSAVSEEKSKMSQPIRGQGSHLVFPIGPKNTNLVEDVENFVFFGPIGKRRWPPWPLIGWVIFDFSSETAEWNSTKLDRKQDLKVLYQFCVFRADWKTRWPPCPLIGWDIVDFSSETAERNSTKLDRKQDLNVLYQVCVFRADRKNKMAALASDWLRHFRLLLWNRWRNSTKLDRKQDLTVLYQVCVFRADRINKMAALASDWLRHFRLLLWNQVTEFNETWQEARSQLPLPSLCFWGRSEKKDGHPGLWLHFFVAETFSTSPLKPLNGIQRNLRGSKISMSSTKFVFFGPIGKTRQPPWPLIGWDIFDFSSETAERNSTNLDRKQDLNVLYQVCVFRAYRKNKMAALASDWLRHFRLLLWNRWTEFNETWQEARSYCPLPSLCFSGRSEKQDDRPALWLAETFSTSPLKPRNGIQRNLKGSKISMTSTKFVFFRPIRKTRWPPCPLIGWDIFDFFSETAERNSTKLDRKQEFNVLYQVCVFGPIGKTRWPPWPLIGWDIFDFSSETAERNSTKLDRKQDLNVLYQVCVFRADRKNKMAALTSNWLRHFRFLLWNRWMEFNETWQEARSQRPLPSTFL